MRLQFVLSWSQLRALMFAIVAIATLNTGGRAASQTPDADRWSKVYAANDLGLEAGKPFHLQMTFQLYSLEGKAAETGTIEEWWYSQQDHHTVIHSRSLNRDSDVPEAFDEKTAREENLVDGLLDLTLQPVPKGYAHGVSDMNEAERSFGKATLTCLEAKSAKPTGVFMMPSTTTVCTDKGTEVVRAVLFPQASKAFLRNSIGKLGDIFVGMDEQIQWFDRQAIAGKVTLLTTIPAKAIEPPPDAAASSGAPGTKPVTAAPANKTPRIAGGVVAGLRTKSVQPEYPMIAKQGRISGVVLLAAVISKEGSIEHLVVLGSTDQMFSEAAVAAVRQWQYKPFLLNGSPTDVETTITVNFNIK